MHQPIRLVTIAFGLALASTAAFADTELKSGSGMAPDRLERITAVTDKYIADNLIAGSVFMLYRHGQIAYVQARGYQDREAKIPMKRDSIFTLASMSKPITAVATMILVEEGKIRLDDPIDKFLPELANRKILNRPDGPLTEMHPASRPITLRDLLTYRIGFGQPEPSQVPADAPIAKAAAQLLTPETTGDEFMKKLGALPFIYDPGYRFMYNVPSLVLGVLIQRVSGEPLDKFMEENIFRPLGMKDTGFWVPESKRGRFTTAYIAGPTPGTLVRDPKSDERMLKPPVFPSGAGGLVSTADDYMKFARMMLQKGEVDGVRILSRKSIELMTQDYMTPEQHEMFWGLPGFWSENGFGFGVEIQTKQPRLGPSLGSFHWNGASGVTWIADPKEDLIYLNMIQRSGILPFSNWDRDYENAVYQAISD